MGVGKNKSNTVGGGEGQWKQKKNRDSKSGNLLPSNSGKNLEKERDQWSNMDMHPVSAGRGNQVEEELQKFPDDCSSRFLCGWLNCPTLDVSAGGIVLPGVDLVMFRI